MNVRVWQIIKRIAIAVVLAACAFVLQTSVKSARYEWDILDKTVIATRPSIARGVSVFGTSATASVRVREVDVVYQTRIQRERFGDRTKDYEAARGRCIIDTNVMEALSENGRVMHPMPRVDEIDPAVDTDPRAAYFRQAHNGLYIRMAMLKMVLAALSFMVAYAILTLFLVFVTAVGFHSIAGFPFHDRAA